MSRVVRLGALVDLDEPETRGATVSFTVAEFADLGDGRRLILCDGRGFSLRVWGPDAPADPLAAITRAEVERDVLTTVLPDEDDGEDHPWGWLAERLRSHGVAVTEPEIRAVPYVVLLAERLEAALARAEA